MIPDHPHLRAFLYALQFLTRIPVPAMPPPEREDHARAALYYPVVGALLGLLMVLLAWLLQPADGMLVAALLLLAWIILTGALHLDGLADSADAWLGGIGDIDKTHRILKDPLVGTAGVVAVACIMLIKYSALYVLIKQEHYISLLLAPALGRGLVLLLFTTTDYVRKQGLASAVIGGLNGRAALLGLIPLMMIAAWASLPALLGLLLIFAALRKLMIVRLGGCTGDTAGASVEIGEAAWIWLSALLISWAGS